MDHELQAAADALNALGLLAGALVLSGVALLVRRWPR
jgi:hypothetical protein